jgi:hypothetical protein
MDKFVIERGKILVGALELAQVGHGDPVQARAIGRLGCQGVDDFRLVGHDLKHQLGDL